MGEKPKTQAQVELFKADTTWFHIFHDLVKSKAWAGMSGAAKIVYITAKAFVNWKTGSAFPSLETLEEYSGMSRPSITKALKELEKTGHIRAKKAPGKQTIYTMLERFPITGEDGRPAAVATFDYLPSLVKDATAELKNFIAQGMTDAGKLQYIHIEKLVLNVAGRDVNNAQGDQTIFNRDAAPDPWHLATQRWAAGELSDHAYHAEMRRLEEEERAKKEG